MNSRRAGSRWMVLVCLIFSASFGFSTASPAGSLEPPISSTAAGSYGGIEYVRHTGRFSGVTAQGFYYVPYEIWAPANATERNGTVVIEPPHFFYGATAGRDELIGRDVLFGQGFAHASVGFSPFLMNILDPTAMDVVIGGRDVAIVKQFSEALAADPVARDLLGPLAARYAFGASQSAEVLLELMYGPGAEGLFDLTLLSVTAWRVDSPPTWFPPVPDALPDDFVPVDGVGKVLLVNAEGDQLFSQSEELRAAVDHPDYRLYEVAGAAHLPLPLTDPLRGLYNPLGTWGEFDVTRAVFVAGHRWVQAGEAPPPNTLLDAAPAGQIDPVYGVVTGIARDANLNALGGVRYPDVEVGRALFIASDLDEGVPVPGLDDLTGLVGNYFDLACVPAPGDASQKPRFRNHGDYVNQVARQTSRLVAQRFLLPEDGERLVQIAAQSQVGRPGSCGP
jgi:hypothetical protein